MSITFDLFHHETDLRTFAANEVIFHQGAPGDVLFAVLEGQVEIRREGKTIAVVTPGQIFGEMAVIDQKPRSAQAVAATACKLAAVPPIRFMRMVQINPFFAVQVMQNLCEKLRGNQES